MTKNKLTSSFCLALVLASPMVGADAQFPAADFKPSVIFQDADLISKHSQAAKARALAKPQPAQVANTSSAIAAEGSNADSGAGPEKALSQQEDSVMENFPIVLIILALAGFVFWSSRRSGSKAMPSAGIVAPVPVGAAVETGVARYVKAIEEAARKAAETGVDRYLQKIEASVQSKAPTPAAEATGVDRYLKGK